MANVEWLEAATKDLRGIDEAVAKKILDKISWFSANFSQIVPEPLTGGLKGTYKIRVGEATGTVAFQAAATGWKPVVPTQGVHHAKDRSNIHQA